MKIRFGLIHLGLATLLGLFSFSSVLAGDSEESLIDMRRENQTAKSRAEEVAKAGTVKKARSRSVPQETVSGSGESTGNIAEPQMVRISGGGFQMGASSSETGSENDERPVHWVQVAAFKLGKYEVTRAEFAAFVDETGYSGSGCWTMNEAGKVEEQSSANWRNPGISQGKRHPVVCVSWEDAYAYARWLSHKTGKHYRLPTDAEWEYAARAGTTTARYWGEDESGACIYANVADLTAKSRFSDWTAHSCSDGYVYTAPVGSLQPNAFGLYDMLGNVWEWTCTDYTKRYDGTETTCNSGAEGGRVRRGGGWGNKPTSVRAATRSSDGPTFRFNDLGFRLVED